MTGARRRLHRLAKNAVLHYSGIMRGKILTAVLFLLTGILAAANVTAETCRPTEPDMLGPFYKPGAPVRESVGKGYMLKGVVRSAKDCSPQAGAQVEFWLANPDKDYDDDHRATVIADRSGAYRFESNQPKPYWGRPPHIHIRVSAKGFKTLVTQHYPQKDAASASLDLVLIPQQDPSD